MCATAPRQWQRAAEARIPKITWVPAIEPFRWCGGFRPGLYPLPPPPCIENLAPQYLFVCLCVYVHGHTRHICPRQLQDSAENFWEWYPFSGNFVSKTTFVKNVTAIVNMPFTPPSLADRVWMPGAAAPTRVPIVREN